MHAVFCVAALRYSIGQTERELCHREGNMFDFKKNNNNKKMRGVEEVL